MFYRAIKTWTFIATIVLAQQAHALDEFFKHLTEPDQQLLELMEKRCFEPEYLMSFPDGFTSREHNHACNVAAFSSHQSIKESPETYDCPRPNMKASTSMKRESSVIIDPSMTNQRS